MLDIFKSRKSFFLLCSVLFLQLFFAYGRMNELFLDGRMHFYHDNARVLNQALDSNIDIPLSLKASLFRWAGVTRIERSSTGQFEEMGHDTTQPILSATLFRLYTQLMGYGEWVPRSVALFLSLACTLFLFAFLLISTKSVGTSWFLSLLYVLLPIQVMYQTQWKGFHWVHFFILATLYFFSTLKYSKHHRRAFILCFFLSLFTGWSAYIGGVVLLVFLWMKRRVPEFKLLPLILSILFVVGLVLNFGSLVALGLTGGEFLTVLKANLGMGQPELGWVWLRKQVAFLDYNFGQINIAVFIMLAIYVVGVGIYFNNILLLVSLLFFAMAFIPTLLFRHMSYINHIYQVYFGLSYITLVGGTLVSIKEKVWIGKQLKKKYTTQ